MLYKSKNADLSFKEVTTNFYEGNLKVCIECMSFDFCENTFCVDMKGNLFFVDRDALDEAGDMAMSNHSQELFYPVVISLLDEDEKAMPTWKKILTNKWVATIIVLIPSYLLGQVGYAEIWALFGSANQLLSVLSLAAVAVFLKKTKKDNKMMFIPMFFMLAVTVVALIQLAWGNIKNFGKASISVMGQSLQIVFAVLLLALAIIVVVNCCKKLFGKEENN